MTRDDLQNLISITLEDMAEQANYLYTQGMAEEAEALRSEGLMIAGAWDNEETFMVLGQATEA